MRCWCPPLLRAGAADAVLPQFVASGVGPKKIAVVLDSGEGNARFFQGLQGVCVWPLSPTGLDRISPGW
jgi:hypothetical protein